MDVSKTICSTCVICAGSVLLVRRARDYREVAYGRGTWELPGGAPEFGEDPVAALRRELAEEVGITLPPAVRPAILDACGYCLTAGSVRAYRIAIVYAVALPGEPAIRLGEEVDAHAFVPAAAAAGRVAIPALAALLRRHAHALAARR